MELTTKQEAGLKLLKSSLRKKFPYITDVKFNLDKIEKYGTMIGVDIYFDLDKLYSVTNTYPQEIYLTHPTIRTLLKEPRSYLMTFMDDQFRPDYGMDFNAKLEKSMNTYYKNLPPGMCLTRYEGWSDDRLRDNSSEMLPADFYTKWRDEKEPVDLRIDNFIPIINKDSKYYSED